MEFYLEPLTIPGTEPVSVAQARKNSGIDDNEFDLELEQSIREAREYLETRTEATLITRQWKLTLNSFPRCQRFFRLPRWPVQSIESIEYKDTAGNTQTWAAENYRLLKQHNGRAELHLAYNKIWPTTLCEAGAIVIEFTAGFGDNPESVPALWTRPLLLLTSHWFENREAAVTGTIVSEINYGIEPIIAALVDPEDDLL